jgi:hypothetical protein
MAQSEAPRPSLINRVIYGQRHPTDSEKSAEFTVRKRVGAVESNALSMRDVEFLTDSEWKERRILAGTKLLRSSDATQGEIDFLLGKIEHDPNPEHQINWDAGNKERDVDVTLPEQRPPFFAVVWESERDAGVRAKKETGEDYPDQILPKGKPIKAKALGRGSFDVIYRRGKPLVRHGHIEIRGKRIAPLPPRVERNIVARERVNHGHY